MITDKKAVVVSVENPTPLAFLNLYEVGDVWIKIKGCESCPKEQRIECCGNCPCITPTGDCYWQVGEQKKNSRKSFFCIISPLPTKRNSRCCIEYECIEGTHKGLIRRVRDKLNDFVE